MNNKYSVACITLVRDKYTLQFNRRCYGLRGIYGRFDSKSNRTADSIRDSIRTQKTIRSSLLRINARRRPVMDYLSTEFGVDSPSRFSITASVDN